MFVLFYFLFFLFRGSRNAPPPKNKTKRDTQPGPRDLQSARIRTVPPLVRGPYEKRAPTSSSIKDKKVNKKKKQKRQTPRAPRCAALRQRSLAKPPLHPARRSSSRPRACSFSPGTWKEEPQTKNDTQKYKKKNRKILEKSAHPPVVQRVGASQSVYFGSHRPHPVKHCGQKDCNIKSIYVQLRLSLISVSAAKYHAHHNFTVAACTLSFSLSWHIFSITVKSLQHIVSYITSLSLSLSTGPALLTLLPPASAWHTAIYGAPRGPPCRTPPKSPGTRTRRKCNRRAPCRRNPPCRRGEKKETKKKRGVRNVLRKIYNFYVELGAERGKISKYENTTWYFTHTYNIQVCGLFREQTSSGDWRVTRTSYDVCTVVFAKQKNLS